MGTTRRRALGAVVTLLMSGLGLSSHAPASAAAPDCGRLLSPGRRVSPLGAMTRDGRFVVVGEDRQDGAVDVVRVDADTGDRVPLTSAPVSRVVGAAISDDGDRIALSVVRTDVTSAQLLVSVAGGTSQAFGTRPLARLAMSGDGATVVFVGQDGVVSQFASGVVTDLATLTDTPSAIAVSRDGRYVAAASFAVAGAVVTDATHVYDRHAPVSLPVTETMRSGVGADLRLSDDGLRLFSTVPGATSADATVETMLWSSGVRSTVTTGNLLDVTGDGRYVLFADGDGRNERLDRTTGAVVPMNAPVIGPLADGMLRDDGSQAVLSTKPGILLPDTWIVPAGLPGASVTFDDGPYRGGTSRATFVLDGVSDVVAAPGSPDVLTLDGPGATTGTLEVGLTGPNVRRLSLVGTNGCTAQLPYVLAGSVSAGPVGGGTRLLDTRPATAVHWSGPKPAAGEVVRVGVAGPAGPSDYLMLNITVDEASAPGYVTAYDCRERPTMSSVNATPGIISANLAVAPTEDGYTVCLYTQSSVHLIVDLVQSIDEVRRPTFGAGRLLDTRETGSKPGAGSVTEIDVGPRLPIALLNVTGVDATAPGFLTVYPCGVPRPLASNLNLVPGVVTANLVLVAAGVDDKVCIYSQSGAHLVVDLPLRQPFDMAVPYTPTRLLDTREGAAGKPAAGSVVEVQVPDAQAKAVLNVTAVDADAAGYVTVYACGADRPLTSSLNVTPGRITANLVLGAIGVDRRVCLYTQSSTHLVVDLVGNT